jgi:hypothetical protein
MLLATFCMLPNAIVRIVRVPSFVVPLCIWSLLIVIVVLVDCAIHRRFHPLFRWAGVEIVLLWFALFLGTSSTWQHVAQFAVS